MTYTRAIGVVFGAAIDRIVRWLALSRIHPNVLTFLGLVINIVAAYLFAAGSFRWAGAVVIGARLFARSEDYILALGVPRVGKGEGFVIPGVLRHKGPAVVTATRHDTYMDTAGVRSRLGPVYVFDPQDLVPGAEKLRWN